MSSELWRHAGIRSVHNAL